MSSRNKLVKAIQNLVRQMMQLARVITKTLMNWLLRSLMVIGRSSKLAKSGFILPTVTMVILVVILLTTAMVFRSFDRSKNASNVRVNQAVLAAAGPGIDRAKAKIKQLLADPTLPRSTPTDVALHNAIAGNLPSYTLGDETPLKLVHNFGNGAGGGANGSIEATAPNGTGASSLENDETLTTAWRFPVDTDNNGKFDSYTLYGLYFRSPTVNANRPRTFLEARTPPMNSSSAGDGCTAGGTSASLVGSSGWYKSSDGNLEKSFFVFSTTVPIVTPPAGDYEAYKGNKGFSALEYQQDQARIPLTNNAVVYEDDLEITPGSPLRINGRIMTNGNFLTGSRGAAIQYYQVSSKNSCFYKEENGKITVGGNLLIGSAEGGATGSVAVDLFKQNNVPNGPATLSTDHPSVSNSTPEATYNSQAYAKRIDDLVKSTTSIPPEIQKKITGGVDPNKALQNYFKDRMRRVPFAEVAATANPNPLTASDLQGTGDNLRPVDSLSYPVTPDAATGVTTGGSNNSLTLVKTQPPAQDPTKINGTETKLGDRILVGNGLPAKWWDKTKGKFADFYTQTTQQVDTSTTWESSSKLRTRMTQAVPLSDLGDTDRDGFWERKAAEKPDIALAGVGGLRVVTGAGIYDPTNSFLPKPPASFPIADDYSTLEDESTGFTVVLPDSMPMWEDTNKDGIPALPLDKRGDLLMRATAVYHYRASAYPYSSTYPVSTAPEQRPIACVSSYYDPSTSATAQNQTGLPPSMVPGVSGSAGLSNNGISYGVSAQTPSTIGAGSRNAQGVFTTPAPVPPSGTGSLRAKLNYQANLIFPNGRFANEPLRAALKQLDTPKPLTLAHQSAIDSTLCALQIADGTLTPNASVIPHGAIYETAFLDARQVKATEGSDAIPSNYDLSIEERQPLEIRTTVLDLDLLRRSPTGGITGTSPVPTTPKPEYLLPDSGIIYATRDDALPDLSAPGDNPAPTASPPNLLEEQKRLATRKLNSPVDFALDPARRPNGIMLINGSILARGGTGFGNGDNTYKQTEKGLILATNLPVYVKADSTNTFNQHQKPDGTLLEEFSDLKLANTPAWTRNQFYNRNAKEANFACRNGQPGLNCNPGDLWRPATVLADSVTPLSNNFRFGFRNEGDYDLRKNVDNLGNNLRFGGYDFNSDNDYLDPLPFGETAVGIDLNGNGTIEPNATVITEEQVTVAAGRRLNGFFDNNYLTSADWFDPSNGYPKDFDVAGGQQGSSYVNNFVTPIQRRTDFPEYVMEICRKPLVSECQPKDWVVNINGGPDIKASTIPAGTLVAQLQGTAITKGAGTTARYPLNPAEQRYPRRVAFLRNPANNNLVLDASSRPAPLGIASNGTVRYYTYTQSAILGLPAGITPSVDTSAKFPEAADNALWFKTTNNANPSAPAGGRYSNNLPLFYLTPLAGSGGVGTTQQPLLVPMLQIHTPTGNPNGGFFPSVAGSGEQETWMQKPDANTTFNLIIAAGDNPIRNTTATTPPVAEFNGGLPNFVMFLENWNNNNSSPSTARINGSFIQFKRTSYATAPFLSVLTPTVTPAGIFGYPQLYRIANNTPSGATGWGRTPYYSAPRREWGFDVGLLSQLPDLFSQQITTPSAGEPSEFYREVGRDDPWVKTLLCASPGQRTGMTNNYNYTGYAIDTSQHPSSGCP
ncbi:hormogonium polysaccharide biosynthesis protein HpsA [Trichocoleus sp. Lan]|uniref:hormogonium polysaccharide biosynthesis protein HpsA n=1 Tax=Trichocoleus sp. Lan TaxID=2933927 RepID=UPI003298B70F